MQTAEPITVTLTTKNSFLHFEESKPEARRRCYSDATELTRSYERRGDPSSDSESTADTADRPLSPEPVRPEPQPYLLDYVKPEVEPQYLLSEEPKPKKKRREAPPAQDHEITLMVRNIPNKYTPEGLLKVFDHYRRWITFYYLPTDFKNKCNLGYAFVNFNDKAVADNFAAELEHSKLPQFEKSEKVLIVQPARVQGLAANMKRFRNSSVMGVLPEDCKPMLFEDGVMVSFPAPAPGKKLPPIGPRFRANAQ